MAKLIFKCRYLKSGSGAAGYLKYFATRDGVEKPDRRSITPIGRSPSRRSYGGRARTGLTLRASSLGSAPPERELLPSWMKATCMPS